MGGEGSGRRARLKKEADQSSSACELVLCEDPDTGEILVKPKGACPRGYIEKFRDKAQESGITFIIPRVKTLEEG